MSFSCKAKKTFIETPYQLIKSEKTWRYNLLTYKKNSDTILAVIPNEVYKNCNKSNFKFFNDTSYKKVSGVGMESIFMNFYYKVETTNGQEINAGDFAPGDIKDMIYSYRDFPYFINDCQPFKAND